MHFHSKNCFLILGLMSCSLHALAADDFRVDVYKDDPIAGKYIIHAKVSGDANAAVDAEAERCLKFSSKYASSIGVAGYEVNVSNWGDSIIITPDHVPQAIAFRMDVIISNQCAKDINTYIASWHSTQTDYWVGKEVTIAAATVSAIQPLPLVVK